MSRLSVIVAAAAIIVPTSAFVVANAAMDERGAQPPVYRAAPVASHQPAPAPIEGIACGERDALVADLAQQFSERPLATGLVDEQALLEIFVSDAGTWTILATGTDGTSCVLAAGEGFDPRMPPELDAGA